jgi:hypothetical protein
MRVFLKSVKSPKKEPQPQRAPSSRRFLKGKLDKYRFDGIEAVLVMESEIPSLISGLRSLQVPFLKGIQTLCPYKLP